MSTENRPDMMTRRALPYYVRALALGIPGLLLGVQLSGWFHFAPAIYTGQADFRTFYAAGYMVRTGRAAQLFHFNDVKATQDAVVSRTEVPLPYVHPAYEAVLFAPFSLLKYLPAYFVFLAFNFGLLVTSIRFLSPHLSALRKFGAYAPLAFAVCFIPTGVALMQGQDCLLLLLLFASSMHHFLKGNLFTSGLILGLGMFRFQVVAPIAFLFLLWRLWRIVLGFSISCGVVTLISVWMTGWQGARSSINMLMSLSSGADPAFQRPLGVMPNVRGFIYGVSHWWIPMSTLRTVSLVGALAILIAVGAARPRAWQFPIAILAAALASYHLLVDDVAILLVPVLFATNDSLRANRREDKHLLFVTTATYASPLLLSLGLDYFFPAALCITLMLAALIQSAQMASRQPQPEEIILAAS